MGLLSRRVNRMTHPSHRFRLLLQLSACASCLCLGLSFACGGTAENDTPKDATNGPTTVTGATNSTNAGSTNAGSTNAGSTNGGTTTNGSTGSGGTTGTDCPSLEPAQGS